MLFSVVTPTHNRADYLPEALASVQASILAGIDADWQHLVFNAGSTDNTTTVLDQAASERLRVFGTGEKRGAGLGRNRLIEQAQGEWIVPLDDDDLLLQRTLFHYGLHAQQHPAARWLIADFLRVDEDRRYLPNEDYYAWRFESAPQMLHAIFRGEHFVQGNVCYQRALWAEVGGYDEGLDMAEDLDLYVRFLLAGHLPVVCPHVSHLHRFHRRNVSIGIDANRHRADLATIYGKYADRLMAVGVEAPASLPL
ncbi:MAG: glycosyltransferase [Hymenobacteraceae bacterium]|nr:glycosyltransferase [Hymenobacteraceae bacterium]